VDLGRVVLKEGKERKVRNFYPWIQRGECRAEGVENGALARLVDHQGRHLAIGTYNGSSRFQFRVLSLEDRTIDQQFFIDRLSAAKELRQALFPGIDALRVVYSEADLTPGLIVDRFGGTLVVQVRSMGIDRIRDLWEPALLEVWKPDRILEKSDMAGREEEGLKPRTEWMHGEPIDSVIIEELGLTYEVPLLGGLKTGHYLDQRETKRRFAERVRPRQKILDCFCYTGGFTLTAAKAGAIAYGVDIHEKAIEIARDNSRRNGLEAVFIHENAFDYLTQDSLGPYDWIILDPPAIAKTASKRDSLKWAVWKLVKSALPKLKTGGRLIVCSCSYQLDQNELVQTCRLAASDEGTRLILEDVTFQDLDHPAPVHFPEALYLKCAWLRKA
jgi:23S rRNA (cytosine1962-C5)-methyltransferase